MTKSCKSPSALQKMFQDGVSLSAQFNAGRLPSGHFAAKNSTTEQLGKMELRPYTLEEKLHALKQMIAKGVIAVAASVSIETVRAELQKPENDGLGVRQMVSLLADKNLVDHVHLAQNAPKLQPLTL